MIDHDFAPIFGTGAAALLFAAVFLFGGRFHPMRTLITDRRSVVSFGAGISVAYVFVHLMPELHGARRAFAEAATIELRYEGMAIYYLALIGFLAFYGLEHLRQRVRDPAQAGQGEASFRIHIGGYAAYVALMAYLLVHKLEGGSNSMALFAVAMAVHFLGVDHALRHEHGAAYERSGHLILAAMLVAFVSGAVIMNSAVMELPSESDGRFLPFLYGGLLYGLILLPLG